MLVTVEFATLSVACPLEPLSARIPISLAKAKQFSIFNSASSVGVLQTKPKELAHATLLRTVTNEPGQNRKNPHHAIKLRSYSYESIRAERKSDIICRLAIGSYGRQLTK